MKTLNTRKRISPGTILAVLAMFLAFSCSGGTTDHTGVPTSKNPDPKPGQPGPEPPPCPDSAPALLTADNSGRQIVSIPDANLEAKVKSFLGKSGNAPIYRQEIAALRFLHIPRSGIKSLEGLQYAENLIHLYADYNSICDLSPLSGLTKIEVLWINSNPINLDSQISAIGGLSSLKALHIQSLYIQDLSSVARFANLESLFLGDSNIALPDLSPLRNLSNLRTLYIVRAGVSDISALSSLAKLKELDLERNQVSDLSPLANLGELAYLSLRYNKVTDISPLISNSGLGSGDLIDLRDNPLSSSSTNSHVPQLLARGTGVLFGTYEELKQPDPEPKQPDPEPKQPDPEPKQPDPEPEQPDPEPEQPGPEPPPCPDSAPALLTADNSGRQIVSIPDANLEAEVKSSLGKSGNAPIYQDEMAALRFLHISGREIQSLEGLQYAENLINLSAGYNSICDLSPLSGLTKIEVLWINSNPINLDSQISAIGGLSSLKALHIQGLYIQDLSSVARFANLESLFLGDSNIVLPDLSPLRNLSNLRILYIVRAGVSDISALSSLVRLEDLGLEGNQISDLSPLANLGELAYLSLRYNKVTDISPLISNSGLGSGDLIDLKDNPLSSSSTNSHVPQLLARGTDVLFDEILITAENALQIYNDNVFVMAADTDIASSRPSYESLSAVFYEHFEDVFDFLIIVLNLSPGESRIGYLGSNAPVTNDVRGIGHSTYSNNSLGSDGKLKSIVDLVEYNGISDGPILHELMHQWGNWIVSPFVHWRFTSADGQLGGFARENFESLGNGRYAAGHFPPRGYANQAKPYSPIELYLAGFIPADEVPDLLVAENASFLYEGGRIVRTEEGYNVFTATAITTHTIEDIIARHGERVPGVSDSQKDFRAAVIFLIDEDRPATRERLDTVSRNVSWFANPQGDSNDSIFNFYEATGGRATIRMDGLREVKK